jgi:hypothetical protein
VTSRTNWTITQRWAVKRAGNLDRMIAEAKKDDAVLFKQSTILLDALSQLLTGLGDEAGALYAASLARLLDAKKRRRFARRRT